MMHHFKTSSLLAIIGLIVFNFQNCSYSENSPNTEIANQEKKPESISQSRTAIVLGPMSEYQFLMISAEGEEQRYSYLSKDEIGMSSYQVDLNSGRVSSLKDNNLNDCAEFNLSDSLLSDIKDLSSRAQICDLRDILPNPDMVYTQAIIPAYAALKRGDGAEPNYSVKPDRPYFKESFGIYLPLGFGMHGGDHNFEICDDEDSKNLKVLVKTIRIQAKEYCPLAE